MTNHLYYGDNLQVLGEHIPTESVDLVYLDPPFQQPGYLYCAMLKLRVAAYEGHFPCRARLP